MDIPPELQEAAVHAQTDDQPLQVTPRDILAWYGYYRRGSWIVEQIFEHLDELGVVTFPSFAGAYIDAPIYIARRDKLKQLFGANEAEEIAGPPSDDESSGRTPPDGSMHQISRLRAANSPPVSVAPNDSLEKAITIMRMYGYSQLPVMVGEREVKGLVSWRTIGENLAAGRYCKQVRECMEEAPQVPETESMFDVIRRVNTHDCVLVRGFDKRVKGIVTAADISEQFQALSEPFLVLGDIENHLRHLIELAEFDPATLADVRDPGDSRRPVEKAADLTFGEYRRLLENDANWLRLGWNLDRAVFIKELDEIRKIRNDVMHFDPDGVAEDQIKKLRRFSEFLRRLIRTSGSDQVS